MKTEIIIKPEDQALLNAIDQVQDNWHVIPLPDHEMYPLFNRTLVVKGFSDTPLKKPEKRIYVYVSQILTTKSNNTFYKEIIMPTWVIYEYNQEEITRNDGSVITGTEIIKDEAGNIVSEKEIPIKKPSIDYIRLLMHTKSVHLTDLLGRFMEQYMQLYSDDINNI